MAKRLFNFCIAFTIVVVGTRGTLYPGTSEEENKKDVTTTERPESGHLEPYHRLFKAKRQMQWEAIERISSHPDSDKRKRLTVAMVDAIEKVLKQTRVEIQKLGFVPGMAFPYSNNEELKEALSKTLENTAFFADLALHFPDIVGKLYASNKNLKTVVDWGVVFGNATEFYDATSTKLMHLVSQELGLIPKQPDYVNPYSSSSTKNKLNNEQIFDEEYERKIAEAKKKKLSKQKQKRGPRLQAGPKSEL